MENWAEREIELAIRNEAENEEKPGDSGYGIACYRSALKAYESLANDGHSGTSIIITKDILNRLIDHKPLTPIVDDGNYWRKTDIDRRYDYKCFQNTRMSSLFKYIFKDGSVKFTDVDRVAVYYANAPKCSWSNGRATRIIDEMFPITMPYWPTERFKMYCEEFLYNPNNGDYDTVGYLYAIHHNERIEINRFFKEDDTTHKLVEIDKNEYEERKAISKIAKETE